MSTEDTDTTATQETVFFNRKYRVVVFCAFAIAVPFIMFGAKQAWDSNANRVEDWLPAGFSETKKLYWFGEHFGSDELLMVSWDGCDLEDARLDSLADALVKPPSEGAEPLFRYVFTGREALDNFMAPPLEFSRKRAIGRLKGWLIGKDGHTTCAVALVSRAGMNDRHGAVAWAYECAQSACGLAPDEIYVAGSTVDGVAIDQISEEWMMTLNVACFTICIIVMWFFLRSIQLAVMVFITAFLCEQLALALIYYNGSQMDSVMMTMASLVYVLTISAAVHLVNYYRDAIQTHGLMGAPVLAVQHARLPCALAAGTTALGVGSLCVSQIVPISKFGIYSASAVMCAFAVLFILLPTALQQWPIRHWVEPTPGNGRHWEDSRRWKPLLAFVERFHWLIVIIATIGLIFAARGVPRIQTAVSLHALFRTDVKIIRDYDWLETHIGALVPVEIVLRFPKSADRSTLDEMQFVEKVRGTVDGIDDVAGTITAATFAPPLPKPSRGGVTSTSRRAVFERRLERHRPDFIELRYLCDTDEEELWRISVRVPAHRDIDFGPFLDRLREEVRPIVEKAAQDEPGLTVEFCGAIPLVHQAQEQLLHDLIKSFLVAFALIGVTMMILLRGVFAGTLSMIPNILPSVLIFGIMGWVGYAVEIGSMMTASVALGIAVDGTLHFVTWFRRGLHDGYSRRKAVHYAYSRCGIAMAQTTLICGLGILVFVVSRFTPTSRFAWLMFVLLSTALVGDLVVLPAILIGPLGRIFQPRKTAAESDDEQAAQAG